MIDVHHIATLAEHLLAAEATCTPIEVLTLQYPELTVADAYRVQQTIVAKKLARGDRVIGKKIGLTSRANQEVFGVHEPVYGQLLASGVYLESTPVAMATLMQPVLECELTFVMRRRLAGPGVTVSEVLRATEGIMPSLEISDSRLRNWVGRARVADILADSCGTAGMIVGGELHTLHHFDLRYTGMVLEKNGVIMTTGATGAVMGNPAHAVAWLANALARVELALEEGDMVLSGAVAGAVPVTSGDVFRATFGGGLGAVGVRFV